MRPNDSQVKSSAYNVHARYSLVFQQNLRGTVLHVFLNLIDIVCRGTQSEAGFLFSIVKNVLETDLWCCQQFVL